MHPFYQSRTSQYAVRLLLPNRRKGLFLPPIPPFDEGGI
ncbi:hypothetical protein C8K18_109276 [Paraburkholderia sp. GV068]|jgi:hypothetical protein|uniref:Uncharacterized protein n=1 Tax=Paraburkholderia graminis (strain ATCC 700544 / DSM 17151 / LMG 18924 / NCIMB 13744 / C4D1M) TaxID=396598 RepID=B1FZP0_PARG4|nr:hypothetical protein BgramDRAFT_2586 [Paraburkholderia graminis C4D1M]MDR6470698.1 hypothetical protein [Paraburkholderia graminis]PTQ97413.1 hypothetical protein C8K19_109275 [Paraburkholderia sp. GV072]PUB02952.1 hypothetical protein C8K18_109276 [Paraburkholderia sp. GV068]MDR6475238.1 hypothetical protein [Paraburkholderia graminis]